MLNNIYCMRNKLANNSNEQYNNNCKNIEDIELEIEVKLV
jgi:hypothetical protein